ncbi:hypothetical protein ElyMa_005264000 [Elysia marginata]|uniref:Sfi1 spindle body domain-containing protein n=1 Tax=Elysia marginata TaxID=1093978 RepID=A0AAV4JYL6_9GAST|nr:hypothetical protein ElyMa_005264000 [Elysia marginata]
MSSFDTDTDRLVLLSGGLQASANDHQIRCQRLKEMATLAIIRLKNWPVCLAFEQWREFTSRERQLKKAVTELRARVATLEEARMLRIWRDTYLGASLARKHRTQDQRKQKQILHLWLSRTEEEMQLLPLETQLTNQITRRSLVVCFCVWLVRYRAVTSIRTVVRKSLLSWVFTAWRNYAELKHDITTKSENFRNRRQTKLVFSRWCERLSQAREVEYRHRLAWESYLLLILQQWRVWAAVSKRLAVIEQEVGRGVCRRHLTASFLRWRAMAVKVRSARSTMTQKMTQSLFVAWRCETVRRREEKSRMLRCRVRSYTLLVERLFRQWSTAYQAKQQERQERQLQAEDLARTWGRLWRRRAQKSRGQWLKHELDTRKVAAAFTYWTARLERVHQLHSLLDNLLRRRGTELMSRSLQTWRLQLSSARAGRLRQGRLMFTVLAEWRVFTKESKDRRIRGMALKKALQERSLHVYFRYWVTVARTSQSVQQSVEKRMLFR